MSKRASRRSAPDPAPLPETTRRSRGTRNTEVKAESVEPQENDAGPSKRARPSLRARTKTADEIPELDDEEEGKGYSVRERKSVSYREVPVVEDEEDDGDDLSSAGEDKDETPPPATSRRSAAPDTPAKRRKPSGEDDDPEDKAFRADKVGSGRGGFSVKGAAAAAARARWAKVRLAKEERGEVDDDSKERKKGRVVRRENRAAVEKLKDGETITIRGVEYVVKNDELPIPDDPKGETKIDALGHLKGGREYKVFTFSSEGRDNHEILYALTIDVARTCGYSDSLAFLRRYPVIQKLQCQPGEAEMLVEVGKVAGNMKHRMVTIVPIHNVFKLMGARVIKDGKWVTDDYYEDECLAKCAENGFTPYAPVQEEEIITSTHGIAGVRGDRERDQLVSITKTNALSPFYTLGGPSTHFGGAGIDPWSEGGYGNRRAKLRGAGVTAEDWMYKTALDTRRLDGVLKGYRHERVGLLDGKDLNGWVWMAEEKTDRTTKPEIGSGGESSRITSGLKPPTMDRQRSGLSREVTFEPEQKASMEGEVRESELSYPDWVNPEYDNSNTMDIIKEGIEPIPSTGELPTSNLTSLSEIVDSTNIQPKDEIRTETDQEVLERKARYAYGTGGWYHGSIKAAYEPHTQMPHIPLYTQPTISTYNQLSTLPILSTEKEINPKGAKGIASLEYVFEPTSLDGEVEMRERVIQEAEEWERRHREKRAIHQI